MVGFCIGEYNLIRPDIISTDFNDFIFSDIPP